MKKKILLSVMLICISIFAFGMLTVSAETTGTYGDLTYKIENGEVTITDCDESATVIEIPEEIEGKKVTSIGSSAFEDCDKLTSITIPEGVTEIGYRVFRGCTGLAEITWNAKSVSNITENSNVFYNAGTHGEGIEVVFGDSVKYIPAYLFTTNVAGYEPNVREITVGENVIGVGEKAFYDCKGLTQINWNAKNVLDFTESSRIFSFLYIGSELNVVFGDAVEHIPAYFICGLHSVKGYLTIGENVTSIGNCAFYWWSGLTKITWNAKNVVDIPSSSNVFYNAGTHGEGIEVVFGDSVERIPANLFFIKDSSYRPKVISVDIGESVTSIGMSAFNNCTSINKIYWNAKNISDFTALSAVFKDVGSSDVGIEVVFGDSVERIPAYAFCGYTKYSTAVTSAPLTTVTIGKNVSSVGQNAFGADDKNGCDGLTKVNITDVGAWCNIDFEAKTSNPLYYAKKLYLNNELVNDLVIPDGVTEIKKYIFYNCTGLTSITMSESVNIIGNLTFYNCEGLTNIVIGEGVTTIGEGAFNNCTGLTKINWNAKNVTDFTSSSNVFYNAGTSGDGIDVVFGDSVENIPAYMFYASYKPKVATVSIGKNVTRIGILHFTIVLAWRV